MSLLFDRNMFDKEWMGGQKAVKFVTVSTKSTGFGATQSPGMLQITLQIYGYPSCQNTCLTLYENTYC